MAKKSKADAAASGKMSKAKAGGRSASARLRRNESTSAKAKKSGPTKKPVIEKAKGKATPVLANAFDPTTEQIQTRAYFISERRRRFDLPGDANSDWLEAKRQLLSETRH